MAKNITNLPPSQDGHIFDRALMLEGFEQLENPINKSVREISFANYVRLAPVLGRDDTWVYTLAAAAAQNGFDCVLILEDDAENPPTFDKDFKPKINSARFVPLPEHHRSSFPDIVEEKSLKKETKSWRPFYTTGFGFDENNVSVETLSDGTKVMWLVPREIRKSKPIRSLVSYASPPISDIVEEKLLKKDHNLRRVNEGVTNKRSDPMKKKKSKLDAAALAPIFEGELDRAAMAAALSAAMQEKGLSVREAAEVAGVSDSVISQINGQIVSIDHGAKVLGQLGFETGFYVRPKAPPNIDDEKTSLDNLFAPAEAKAVGEMFARAREGKEISGRAAAKASGIDAKNLRQIENGERSPALDTIRKVAEGLGYDVEIKLTPKDYA